LPRATLLHLLFLLLAANLPSCSSGGDGSGPNPADSGLFDNDFRQVASGGFDDRLNAYPWAMELFDGDGDGTPEVYVGTWGNGQCLQATSLPDPPPDRWQCPNPLFNKEDQSAYRAAARSPAYVYRGTYDDLTDHWTWERVWSPSLNEVEGFRGAGVFGNALYMLGGLTRGIVWKSTNGENWERASPEWMVAYGGYRGAAAYKGKLYIASDLLGAIFCSEDPSTDSGSWTLANSLGFADSGGDTNDIVLFSGAVDTASAESFTSSDIPNLPPVAGTGLFEVRMTSGVAAGQVRQARWNAGTRVYVVYDGQGQAFNPVPQPGDEFEVGAPDYPESGPCWQLTEFNGYLYVAARNPRDGTELWKTDNPGPGNWQRVVTGGYGNRGPQTFIVLEPFGDHLYFGTGTFPQFVKAGQEVEACEILRLDADDNVELLVGKPRSPGTPGTADGRPLANLSPGFGNKTNIYAWQTAVHDGWLYVGTDDVSVKLRDTAGTGNAGAIIGGIIQAITLDRSGFDLFRTQDGIHWVRVTNEGFAERDNFGVRTLLDTPWGLMVGAANAVDGLEVWLGR
jgi:hypothetical protein